MFEGGQGAGNAGREADVEILLGVLDRLRK
jgi:hypothetical protein